MSSVGAEQVLLFLSGFSESGERHDARIFHSRHGDGLGLLESAVEVDGGPGKAPGHLLAHGNHVHDGKGARLLEIFGFFLLEVDAVGPDGAFLDGANDLLIAAGQTQLDGGVMENP